MFHSQHPLFSFQCSSMHFLCLIFSLITKSLCQIVDAGQCLDAPLPAPPHIPVPVHSPSQSHLPPLSVPVYPPYRSTHLIGPISPHSNLVRSTRRASLHSFHPTYQSTFFTSPAYCTKSWWRSISKERRMKLMLFVCVSPLPCAVGVKNFIPF